jgi:hypothetical protein
MFLENDYAEPLFSHNGGPPRAFRCKKCHNKVTATEGGIRSHLRFAHNWEEQPCLSLMESQKDQNKKAPRKLRAGAPSFLKSPEKQEEVSSAKKKIQKSQETKEGELLKLTSEENLPSQTQATSFNFAIATKEEIKPTQDMDTNITKKS